MNVRESRRNDQAGFTLIEALLAMVILSFGMIAITNLLLVAASSNSVGNHSTASTGLASQQMELLRAQTFTNIVPGGSLTADQTGYFRDDNIDGVGSFKTRWRIVQIAGDQQTRFINVRTEPTGGLFKDRGATEFSSFRTCTSVASGCPAP